jgi:hypothetical protein
MRKTYTCKGIIKQFPQKGGWVYVPITQTYKDFGGKPKWGLVPAKITLGSTTWTRSLLPLGDGTLFIALNEKVRKAEKVAVGDTVQISFTV